MEAYEAPGPHQRRVHFKVRTDALVGMVAIDIEKVNWLPFKLGLEFSQDFGPDASRPG